MKDSYKSYVAGVYVKTPYLYLSQFSRLYKELDNKFTRFEKSEKLQFISEANAVLKGYFELFESEKDVCLEIAEQVNDLLTSVLQTDDKDFFIGWWATVQLGKLISQFFLKVKINFKIMMAEHDEMQTEDI